MKSCLQRVLGLLCAVTLGSPAPTNPCESREAYYGSGGATLGRAVDPTRLLSSKTARFGNGSELVVFVGLDQRTLCGCDARDGTMRWTSRLLDASAATVTAEPATLAVGASDAFVVVVVVVVVEQEPASQGSYQQVGLAQHSLATGREVGVVWFEGACLNDGSRGQRRVPWLRPDWRSALAPGDSVDVRVASGAWAEAVVVESQGGRLLVQPSGHDRVLQVPMSPSADDLIQPWRARSTDWAAAVRVGDYVEVAGGAPPGESSSGSPVPGWHLGRVEASSGSLVRVHGEWLPLMTNHHAASATAAPCGTHVAFSDVPRQVAVVEVGSAALVVVLLERVSAHASWCTCCEATS
jgi:hypothetical protein